MLDDDDLISIFWKRGGSSLYYNYYYYYSIGVKNVNSSPLTKKQNHHRTVEWIPYWSSMLFFFCILRLQNGMVWYGMDCKKLFSTVHIINSILYKISLLRTFYYFMTRRRRLMILFVFTHTSTIEENALGSFYIISKTFSLLATY